MSACPEYDEGSVHLAAVSAPAVVKAANLSRRYGQGDAQVVPVAQLVVFGWIAVAAGVGAAVLPARRAARLNVLEHSSTSRHASGGEARGSSLPSFLCVRGQPTSCVIWSIQTVTARMSASSCPAAISMP